MTARTPPERPTPELIAKDPAPTWRELVNQERKLLEGLVELMRATSSRPPAEMDEIVACALEEALQQVIAKEPDEQRADELRRRAAARALARMFRKSPRLVYSRPLPIQRSKNVVARPNNNRHKQRRRRRPHLIIDNDNTLLPACPGAYG